MNHFSPKEVARRLGVSESSVKRWLDQGLVPVLRTAGGHRRVSEESLDELLNQLKATAGFPRLSVVSGEPEPLSGPGTAASARIDPAGGAAADPLLQWDFARQPEGPPAVKDLADVFTEALMHGREDECFRLADRLVASGFPMATAVDLLATTAMHCLGKRWELGEMAIYQERRACGIVKDLIQRLKQRLPVAQGGPVAIGGTTQGDHYELPTALVELSLCERGWNALSLGCNLPVSEFLAAVAEYRPRVLWISLSHIQDEDALVADFNRLAAGIPKETAILIGGRAATDALRPRLRYTSHCDSLRNLAGLADTLMAVR